MSAIDTHMQGIRGRTLKARSFGTLVATVRCLRNILRALTVGSRKKLASSPSDSLSAAVNAHASGKGAQRWHGGTWEESDPLEVSQVSGALRHVAGTPVLPGMWRGAQECHVIVSVPDHLEQPAFSCWFEGNPESCLPNDSWVCLGQTSILFLSQVLQCCIEALYGSLHRNALLSPLFVLVVVLSIENGNSKGHVISSCQSVSYAFETA
jgi:hypothetical protein